MTNTKTYTPSFVYNSNGLEYALFEEGRLIDNSGTFEYQYFLKDHLGNTRVTFSANDGLIKQQDHYYPFGMSFTGITNAQAANVANQYKYNGKELQDNFGLNWYDYGARFYDAQIGRWHSIDPLSESMNAWSPYNYTFNNPIWFIDPNGMAPDDYFNQNGKFLGSDGAKTDNVKIITQKDWDSNKTVNSDGSESIDHVVGKANSTDHSTSNLTENASLKVYDHYNPTDLDVVAHENEDGNGGATLSTKRTKEGIITQKIKVRLDGNIETKIADHANEITNVFVHEEVHYNDIKSSGLDAHAATPKNIRERRAVSTQMNHSSFSKSRPSFQRAVRKYGAMHGMLFPMKPMPARVVK